MPPKIKELLAKLAEQIGKEPAERDDKAIAAIAKDIQGYSDSDEGKGYAGTVELTAAVEQLRKDIDAQATSVRNIQRAGLNVSGGVIQLPAGRSARLEMLRDGRAFADPELAKTFGAVVAVGVAKSGKIGWAVEDLPQYTRDVAKSAEGLTDLLFGAKATPDIEPSSGVGAELYSTYVYMSELIRNVEAYGTVFTEARRVVLPSLLGTTTWPKLSTGMTAYPTAVAAQITKSGAAFTTVTMRPVKWATLTGVPNEMFRDPSMLVELGQFVGIEISRAMAYAFDNAIINGDGTSTYGGITGILQSATIGTVTTAAHTTLSTLDGDDIDDVVAGLSLSIAHANAQFFGSLSVGMKVHGIKDTTGQYIYRTANDTRGQRIVNGYPWVVGQLFPAAAAATAGNKYAAFGDLRMAYYFGMVRSLEIAQSEHVWFDQDMVAIRGLAHVDAKEADADGVVTATLHA